MVLFSLYSSFGQVVCLARLIVFERSKRQKAGNVKRPILFRKAFLCHVCVTVPALGQALAPPRLSGQCHNNVTVKSFVGQTGQPGVSFSRPQRQVEPNE